MRYSVYNPATKSYDYYEAPGSLEGGVFAPAPAMRKTRTVGLAPEEAARPLPVGATKVGSGPMPQGMIATKKGALGMVVFGFDLSTLLLLGGAGYLAWRYLK